MGRLVIKIDKPIVYCLLENNQLLYASELPSENVSELIDKIGDYQIDEVAVYMKFDTRQDVEGVVVDRIRTESVDLQFRVSEGDYAFLKATAMRFSAKKVTFYSAYRHYVSIMRDGVVVDSYIDHNFIVAGIQDGALVSLNVCSSERLQRTIESCQMANITYAESGTIPELVNIETVPAELHETLSFLQYIMFGTPCYAIDIDSGEVFEYGDGDPASKFYQLSPEEYDIALSAIQANFGPNYVKGKRKFSVQDVIVACIYIVAGLIFSVGLLGFLKVNSSTEALETKIAEQTEHMERQAIEERFLEQGILDTTGGTYYQQLVDLNGILKNGAIMSVRFVFNTMELTLFVMDEAMMERAQTELGEYYVIESFEYEDAVTNPQTNETYLQYNVVLSLQ